MTDNTNTTKAQKTDIEGLLGADKVKPFHKRGGFWLVLLVFLGILFAVYYFFFRGSQGQVGFVTQPLTKGNLTVEVSANGTINPIRTVSLGSELSGIVRKVNVDVNDQVKKGEVLIELDDTKLKASVGHISGIPGNAERGQGQTLASAGSQTSFRRQESE